jgi:hypothetical protein
MKNNMSDAKVIFNAKKFATNIATNKTKNG